MPRIPNNLCERAIGMHVARHVGCSSRAIRNLHIRFRTTGSTNDLPRRGRPRVTTRGQGRYIMNTHLRNRFQTATTTAAKTHGLHNNRISMQTVRNCLRENGVHTRRPYFRYSERHRQNRLNSDESRFSLIRGKGGVHVYRRINKHVDCCVLERDRFGGWGFLCGYPWLSFTTSRH